MVVVDRRDDPPAEGRVLVASGGTADIPMAEEAAVCAEVMGNDVVRLWDVGVAGVHRLLAHQEELRNARVIIAVAGMEGALPSLVTGLVDVPVIGVPTSVGYGANFDGLAPLLTMLNSCASGMGVVNIDNGFGGRGSRKSHQPAGVLVSVTLGYLECTFGVSGDKILAALIDAGADLAGLNEALDAFDIGASVTTTSTTVNTIAARQARVDIAGDQPQRAWRDIRALIEGAGLPPAVSRDALAVFAALADAEATVHGVDAEDVHFHEVGAADSIADAVGVAWCLHDLGIERLVASEVTLGFGTVEAQHGTLPVQRSSATTWFCNAARPCPSGAGPNPAPR